MAALFSSSSSMDTDYVDILTQRTNKHNYTSIIDQFIIINLQNKFLSFCGPSIYIA